MAPVVLPALIISVFPKLNPPLTILFKSPNVANVGGVVTPVNPTCFQDSLKSIIVFPAESNCDHETIAPSTVFTPFIGVLNG